jgi:hypothetical protein
MKDALKLMALVLGAIGSILLIAGLMLLKLSPWLLAAYVLFCLVTGTPMLPPGV